MRRNLVSVAIVIVVAYLIIEIGGGFLISSKVLPRKFMHAIHLQSSN